jgi:hypothetical protein
MRTRIQRIHSVGYALAALAILGGVMVACGDDDATDDAAPTTQSAPTTEEAPSTVEEPATTTTTTEPPGEYAELIVDYCEGFGRLDEPGGVDELMGMMTEDVVLTDTLLGGALTGTEMVRGYVTSEVFAGIDTSLCGAAVQRGNWYAGTYSLGSSEVGIGATGITVMHVTDGKIDQHISYYTPDQELVALSTEPVETSKVIDYCNAWDEGGDPDAVVSLLAPAAELHFGGVVIEGADAIGEYVATTFDSDQNDCDTVVVENGEWVAGANTFTNTETGDVVEGVNVTRIDDNEKIVAHYAHLEAPAE